MNKKRRIKKLPILFIQLLGRPYIYLVEGIKNITFKNTQSLYKVMEEFQNGKSRLLIAFRHPTRHDPPVVVYMFLKLLYNRAKLEGYQLDRFNHCHYLYGTWVLMWANRLAKWLFPGIGAIPVSSRNMNIKSIKTIREILQYGDYPLALAPEGQVNYHNGLIESLEPGVINMAAWCKEDLNRTGSDKSIKVLPLTLYYHYPKYEKTLKEIYRRLNRILSIETPTGPTKDQLCIYTKDIIRSIEREYIEIDDSTIHISLPERLTRLTDSVLKSAEEILSISGTGSFLNRVVTIRATIETELQKSGLKEHLAIRHMEVADILEYITPSYIENITDQNRYIEYGLNLLDLYNRFKGGNISTRWSPRGKVVHITSGETLEYKTTNSKQEKRAQITLLTEQLNKEFNKISV